MRDRIKRQGCRDSEIWNSAPGALSIDMSYGDDLDEFPFFHFGNSSSLKANYTAIIHVQSSSSGAKSFKTFSNSPLFKLIRNIGKSRYLSKVYTIVVII